MAIYSLEIVKEQVYPLIQEHIDAGLKITDSKGPNGRLSGKIGKYNQFCFMDGIMVLHCAEIGQYGTVERHTHGMILPAINSNDVDKIISIFIKYPDDYGDDILKEISEYKQKKQKK